VLTVLRASSYRRTPWKNGGGETCEIATAPAGATIDDFDWRLSMATVARDGPFSIFPGVDRTLCILSGGAVTIHVAGAPLHQLDDTSPPFAFPGDLAVSSQLIGAAVADFNVMTRRTRFRHLVERVHLDTGAAHDVRHDVRAVFCQSGAVSVQAGAQHERLAPHDTMLRHAADDRAWIVIGDVDARVLLVTILTTRPERTNP
jgi:hypothetical protein